MIITAMVMIIATLVILVVIKFRVINGIIMIIQRLVLSTVLTKIVL